MALIDGPLVFLTDGTDASLAELANATTFATTLNWPLTVVHVLHTDSGSDLTHMMADVDLTHSVVLAPLPAQPRFLGRFLSGAPHQQLPRKVSAPLLVLPTCARCGTLNHVLFPADLAPRSAAAFEEAIALCKAHDAELHVLHVFGEDRLLPNEIDHARRAAVRSPRELLDIDRDALRAMVAWAADQGVRARAQFAEGRAHAQILSYAAKAKIDLIVMPSHGPRTSEDVVLGTTTERVIHGSLVPVMALPSSPVQTLVSVSA